MTEENFKNQFAVLLNSFPSDRVTPETQSIYWSMLKEIPDGYWIEGIKKCLASCTFFPTVHDIGVACFGEQKEEYVWKCDPYRTIQNYKERIKPETWQQRMERIIAPQIEGPSASVALPKPERPAPPDREEARKVLASISAQIEEKDARKKLKVEEKPSPDIERRREMLREQGKIAIEKYGG